MTGRLILRTAATIHYLSTSSQLSLSSLSATAAENSSEENRCTYRDRKREGETDRQTDRQRHRERWRVLRERDDDEIEPVPGVTEICKASHDETTRQHLHGALHRVYSSEYLPTHGVTQTQWNCNWSTGRYWKPAIGNCRKHPEITLLVNKLCQRFCALCMCHFHLLHFPIIIIHSSVSILRVAVFLILSAYLVAYYFVLYSISCVIEQSATGRCARAPAAGSSQ